MKKTEWNSGWTFTNLLKESESQEVDLPHDAALTESRIPRLKNGSFTGYYPGGRYSYTKKLMVTDTPENRTVIIEFEGAYMKPVVYLNGEKVGERIYGYSNFYVDLTGKLRYCEENEITVITDSTQNQNTRWYSGSGLYRGVNLFTGGMDYIEPDGVYVRTVSHTPAVLEISTRWNGEPGLEVNTELSDESGIVTSASGEICRLEIPSARLWSAEEPNLYKVRISLRKGGKLLDETKLNTGIRRLEWGKGGLKVNGREIKLRGGCIHHDNGPLGACAFPAAEFRKVKILKEAGFNAIRSAHNPLSKAMLDACDSLGLYVMDESFDVWYSRKCDYDYGLYFEDNWEKDISAMILKDRNHPSIIMYSIGNEVGESAQEKGLSYAKEMTALCHRLDPSVPVTCGIHPLMNLLGSKGVALNKSEAAKNDVVDPYDEDKDSKIAGSTFINLIMIIMPKIQKLVTTPKRTEGVVKNIFDILDIAGYNYTHNCYEAHLAKCPDRVIVGTETYPSRIHENWEYVKRNPNVVGDFMWTAWDYLGEGGIGVIEYGRRSGTIAKPYPILTAGVGAIDITGRIDTQARAAALVWGTESRPCIAVRPLDRRGKRKISNQWRRTDGIDSWSWKGMEGRKAVIEVYGPGTSVELFQDGRSLGNKALKSGVALFNTRYRRGHLKAVAYDEHGGVLSYSEMKSASEETMICATVDRAVIKADGSDLSFITVELTDLSGIKKMLEDRKIKVKVDGEGRLQGLGSANSWTEESFCGDAFTTYYGRMIAVVRSTNKAGIIKVSFSAEGLKEKTIQIQAENVYKSE